MACRGVHFAIPDEEAQRLIAAVGNDERVVYIVQEEIEQKWDEAHLCQSDKAWDAMHRCLSDGTLQLNCGSYPLTHCVLGGEQLHEGDDYIVSFVTAKQVSDVAQALLSLTKEWFRERYFAIDQNDYGMPPGFDYELDFEYTWGYFEEVRNFYQKAANEGRAVIFSADQ